MPQWAILRAPPEKLRQYVFPEPKPKAKRRPAKPRVKKETNGEKDDPLLGTLPRAPKAAPPTQTGLDRSKVPCRKWTKQPVALKSVTGFEFDVMEYVSQSKEVKEEPAAAS